MRLARLMVVGLAVGLVWGIAGYVLASAVYAHNLNYPGCGKMGVALANVGLEKVQMSPTSAATNYPLEPGASPRDAAQPQGQLSQAGEPKELWIVPDCNYGGYLAAAPEEWERRVVAFFDTAWK